MEFWGVEVKSGTPLKVQPGDGMVIHLSQASLGEVKANKTESVRLSVTVDGNKLVLGTLMSDKLPQQLFDLVFDKDFELSHNSKYGSIYFFGYKADNGPEEGDEFGESDDDSDEEEEEDIPIVSNNGKPKDIAKPEVPVDAKNAKKGKDSAAGKQKVQIVEPPKVVKPEDEDDSEEDSDYEESDESDEDKTSVGDLMDEDVDSDDSEDEESDEEDDTPQKSAPSKKRAAESATKTPVSEKKAKLATPQKTDGKKSGGHVSTPYPSKQGGKTPANTPANKSSQKSPKSGGPHSCGSCKKGFVSEFAMQAHAKAKHSTEK